MLGTKDFNMGISTILLTLYPESQRSVENVMIAVETYEGCPKS